MFLICHVKNVIKHKILLAPIIAFIFFILLNSIDLFPLKDNPNMILAGFVRFTLIESMLIAQSEMSEISICCIIDDICSADVILSSPTGTFAVQCA